MCFSLHCLVAFSSPGYYRLFEFMSLLGFPDIIFSDYYPILSFFASTTVSSSSTSSFWDRVQGSVFGLVLVSWYLLTIPLTSVTMTISNLNYSVAYGHFPQCLTDQKSIQSEVIVFLLSCDSLPYTILMKTIHPVSQQESLKIVGGFLPPPPTCTKHPRSDYKL